VEVRIAKLTEKERTEINPSERLEEEGTKTTLSTNRSIKKVEGRGTYMTVKKHLREHASKE